MFYNEKTTLGTRYNIKGVINITPRDVYLKHAWYQIGGFITSLLRLFNLAFFNWEWLGLAGPALGLE